MVIAAVVLILVLTATVGWLAFRLRRISRSFRGNRESPMPSRAAEAETGGMRTETAPDCGDRLARLLHRQAAVSDALLDFLHKKDAEEAMRIVLDEILHQLDAVRSYIFEFDADYTFGNCIYEATADGIAPAHENVADIFAGGQDGWVRELLKGTPVVIPDVSQIPADREQVREKLEHSGIGSMIVLPLISAEGVWGCVGVEFTDPRNVRDRDDSLWLASVAGIINICVRLRSVVEESESKRRYVDRLLSVIPAGIELYDAKGKLVEVNDKDVEIFGVQSKEDLLGINIFEHPLATPEMLEKLRCGETINLAFEYSFDKMDNYYKTPQKGTKALITKIIALHDEQGKIVNYLILVVDNTENRNALSRVVEFEEFFSLAGDYAKVGYARYNLLTGEGYAGESWYRNMGLPSDKPLKEVFIGENIHPEDAPARRRFLESVLKGSEKTFRDNLRIGRDDGSYSWTCDQMLVRDYRPEEGIIEIICINYDITEMKRMEAELIEAKEQAETLERLKSVFLANMSHEIRTPLNAIVGFADLLTTTDDPEEKTEYNQIISTNSELLLRLINDILNLSKIEAGFMDRKIEKFDFASYFNDLCASARQRMTRPEVELVCENPYQHCLVQLDKNRLGQVILNYATNAIKYTPEGFIKMGYEFVDGGLRFYVADSGIGISEEKQQRVYQRFEKLDEFAQGTGLGLSICKAITEAAGGKVGFETKEGEGSTFWSWIPCEAELSEKPDGATEAEQDAECVPAVQQRAGDERKRILVAEDIESNFKLISAIIGHQYDLVWATNGEQAVEAARTDHVDLILMDVKMPLMDGLQAAEAIRQFDSSIAIVALTAFAFDSDKEAALEAGCNDYLVKPVNKKMLFETLGKWL